MNNEIDEKNVRSLYEKSVQDRSLVRFILGALVRWINYIKQARIRRIARKNGATLGDEVIIPLSLAKKANKNLVIGNHVCISTDNFSSFRYPVKIGNNVIIGGNVKFVMESHNIDSPDWEHYRPNKELIIEDYVWLCPDCVILPSVEKIAYGTVVGANAVLAKNTNRMAVYGGNPAKELRLRKCVHTKLVVESLLGGDYKAYIKTRKNKLNKI